MKIIFNFISFLLQKDFFLFFFGRGKQVHGFSVNFCRGKRKEKSSAGKKTE